jgi:hypothetical protein
MPFVGVRTIGGAIYCRPVTAAGVHTFSFDELSANCWEGNEGPAPDPTQLESLLFYEPADFVRSVDISGISMCFRDIVALGAQAP